ncbi:fumarylacetoacetate hydrolase family protein [Phytomonospora endophytica]|uniref:2-keto-4-pentenoate hydratase/2-oxohepta-3-ene-1,7-dioic acid hydratase in catechol pathway n=1 Tax=Phytomonospora endophytica TaxID=714109 RepID=A0A841FQN1_9ACTN|nr:fumarylacetoacetate hydrolase family protein [Phytomonospora endophytica]MBB6034869.1 2-keto-4-pentenoate hydratase/2-oxohepta-3-ene-1,7-dioic acid hydratase in catechol pathway [Phytomonospora endophytica]GIG70573.1 hypothetical protein Pen01_68680 [Phytomonospora endophytica]
MHLVTYDDNGTEALGVLRDGRVHATTGPVTMAELIAHPGGLDALTVAPEPLADDARLLAPLPRPRNVVCIGRNYREHAEEQGAETPAEPAVFLKTTTSVVGPGHDIVWDPEYTAQVDYEAELAVVIGRTARHVDVADALSHVFGYTCLNDVSARDLQFGDVQWARGKSLDTFCPMGPAIVTADEVADPQNLDVRCVLNGTTVQEANTSVMYHSVAEIIAHCSRAFTLHPGDVIATGTPGGVGIFRDPPLLLGNGDEVVIEIDGIGRLVNRCRTERV